MKLNIHPHSGGRYEDTYGAWLSIFREAAEQPPTTYENVPRSWCPLLYYLGHEIASETNVFFEDRWVMPGVYSTAKSKGRLREYVEVCSAMRPELVDALFKVDMEWSVTRGLWRHTQQKTFSVTNNGSFFRPEVLDYLRVLEDYLVTAPQEATSLAVFIPCAADKPYPAPIHSAVLDLLQPGEELVIVTGVCGVVPQCLWEHMPLYDSGLPNERRVTEYVNKLVRSRKYPHVVSYSDFYNPAIVEGLVGCDVRFSALFSAHRYIPYQDLLLESNLNKLRKLLEAARSYCGSTSS